MLFLLNKFSYPKFCPQIINSKMTLFILTTILLLFQTCWALDPPLLKPLRESFHTTMVKYIELNGCGSEWIQEPFMDKIKSTHQDWGEDCLADKWEEVIRPIYASISNHSDTRSHRCHLLESLKVALKDESLQNKLCFSNTHVLECDGVKKHCICLRKDPTINQNHVNRTAIENSTSLENGSECQVEETSPPHSNGAKMECFEISMTFGIFSLVVLLFPPGGLIL